MSIIPATQKHTTPTPTEIISKDDDAHAPWRHLNRTTKPLSQHRIKVLLKAEKLATIGRSALSASGRFAKMTLANATVQATTTEATKKTLTSTLEFSTMP
jgi:hypothetical protein